MTHRITFIVAALATVAAPAALAHGNTPHASHGQAHVAHTATPAAAETAFGRPGPASQVTRTLTVEMTDNMRFSPSTLNVKRGETVRLQVLNKGKMLHEFVLGTPEEIKKHARAMKDHPGMAHDEPGMVHVQPGQRGELVWQFTQPGEFQFACLLPGHFEAGMFGKVVVQ